MRSTSPTSNPNRIDRPKSAANKLGVSVVTLWRMRQRHEIPEPVEISPGAIGWTEEELQTWLETRPRRILAGHGAHP